MKQAVNFVFVITGMILNAQVGINNDKPKGALDMNTSEIQDRWGMVLPRVDVVDTISLGNSFYPSVTTPDDPFQVVSVTETDDDGNKITTDYQVPVNEAPAGTVLYDITNHCMRFKKTEVLGDWTGCIVDSAMVSEKINYVIYGGTSFRMKKASAGATFSIAIGMNGAVYTSGIGSDYRTGKGSTSNSTWSVILNQPAVDVSAGYKHGLAALEDGTVWVWGSNANGRTGMGTTSGYTKIPKKISLPDNAGKVIRVEAGYYNSLLLTDTGKVFACGNNNYAILGNGSQGTSGINKVSEFVEIPFTKEIVIKDIALAYRGAAAVDQNGKIYTWGSNSYGRTGVGTTSGYTKVPHDITPINQGFSKIVIGISNGAALTTEGKLYVWGSRRATGNGTSNDLSPVLYVPPVNFSEDEYITNIAVAKGRSNDNPYGSSLIISTTKSLYASGVNTSYDNNSGKLGVLDDNGVAISSGTMQEVQSHAIYSGSVFTGISIGTEHTLVTTGEYSVPAVSNVGYASGGRRRNKAYLYGRTGNRKFFTNVTT